MNRTYQALLSAVIVVVCFTLDSKGLARVDHRGYRPANTTFNVPQHKQWGGIPVVTPRNTNQGWTGGQQMGFNTNNNQWNRYNQTNPGTYNGYQTSNKTNQWQRYNNTPTTYPGTYNPSLPGWNSHQYNSPTLNTTATNWQRHNQSHLYPQLPQSAYNFSGVRPQGQPATTPSGLSLNRWNNTNIYGRGNNTFFPPQQYPGGPLQNQNNSHVGQNRPWNNAPTVSPINGGTNWKNPSSYSHNQTAGINWWNPHNTNSNNYGWSGNAGQNTWGTVGTNGAPNPTNNGWPNNLQNNWQGSSANNSPQDNTNTGPQLAPIGANTGSISRDVPLAPIGGSNAPSAWNSGGNSGSPQLAPLAPLSYGGGNPNDPSKQANVNPYARIVN